MKLYKDIFKKLQKNLILNCLENTMYTISYFIFQYLRTCKSIYNNFCIIIE